MCEREIELSVICSHIHFIFVLVSAGSDFAPMNLTLSFQAGETQQCFTFDPIDDTAVEPTEVLSVKVSSDNQEVSFSPGRETAIIDILDDDGGKYIYITGVLQCSQRSSDIFNFVNGTDA